MLRVTKDTVSLRYFLKKKGIEYDKIELDTLGNPVFCYNKTVAVNDALSEYGRIMGEGGYEALQNYMFGDKEEE